MRIDALKLAVWIVIAALPGVSFARSASPTAIALKAQETIATSSSSAADDAYRAWQAYRDSIAEALIDSDRPRDWMLAANTLSFLGGDSIKPPHPSREELIERATRRASDDVLVQWVAANDRSGGSTCVAKSTPDENIGSLTRLEPDNAATWMMALALASNRNDPALVDDALAHMASSGRYDDHFADTLHAWLDVYDRFPLPPSSVRTSAFASGWPRMTESNLQSMVAFTSALAQTAATAIPAYQGLITACKPGRNDSGNWRRHAYCEDTGRLMLGKGQTFIARSIGFAILRDLGALDSADQQERRNLDWYTQKSIDASGFERGDIAAIEAFQTDWRNLDDEIEVTKRALRRAGLPDEAPVGWAAAVWSTPKKP